MKIMLATSMSGLGGTENASLRLGKLLAAHGHEVHLASSDGPLIPEAEAAGIKWHNIDFYQGAAGYLKGTAAFFKLLKAERPDIVHCQMARIVPACATMAKIASPKTKVFYHARGLDPETYPRIAKIFDKLGVYIIANCKHEREKIIRHGFPAARIAYTYNALPDAPETAEKPARDTVMLGTLSRLNATRNVADSIRVCKRLLDKGLDVKMQIGGIGEETDALKALVLDSELAGKVKFLGAVRDLNAFFADTDILLNNLNLVGDHGAGVGNNILEAGLYRTAVVSYDAAGISEMVEHGETGFCTPVNDLDTFTGAVETLVRDAALRRRFGDALHGRVTRLCSDEEIYRTTLAAYEL
ncbi:hypothetical protein BG910_03035 [Neisseria chenwenguii]|uniref:Glycosyl transferase n=1 Tax=Neisseria chenwenguii TaxID=1853278 RepID=A0A220S0C5_9NEIS|nr:glycosyltransferase [Neisseria chenwenguii]ASK26852.1 hypothetical protein BG910_03035 [Neisseria chenwenguii]